MTSYSTHAHPVQPRPWWMLLRYFVDHQARTHVGAHHVLRQGPFFRDRARIDLTHHVQLCSAPASALRATGGHTKHSQHTTRCIALAPARQRCAHSPRQSATHARVHWGKNRRAPAPITSPHTRGAARSSTRNSHNCGYAAAQWPLATHPSQQAAGTGNMATTKLGVQGTPEQQGRAGFAGLGIAESRSSH